MLRYIKFDDLNQIIRNNLDRIPHDIDGIIGIPRSGLICAGFLSEYLCKPLYSVDSFLNGTTIGNGYTFVDMGGKYNRFIVIDDGIGKGVTTKQIRKQLTEKYPNYEFIMICVVGRDKEFCKKWNVDDQAIDIMLETDDLEWYTEYNIFRMPWVKHMLFDFDGVLCKDPDIDTDKNNDEYRNFIINTPPVFANFPYPIGGIVTGRPKYLYNETVQWLKQHNITLINPNNIIMVDANSHNELFEAREKYPPVLMKSNIYKVTQFARIFVESSPHEAEIIHKISGKPVLCTTTNTMIGS